MGASDAHGSGDVVERKSQEDAAARTAEASDAPTPSRRRFLSRISGAVGAFVTFVISVPIIGLLISPARRERNVWRAVGAVERFAIGETVLVTYVDPDPLPWAGFAARSTAWLRRESPVEFVAFSPYCTHTGCPVTWSAGAELFLCPCHGGTFRRDGRVAGGPPPLPLERLEVRVRGGQVEVRTLGVPAAT